MSDSKVIWIGSAEKTALGDIWVAVGKNGLVAVIVGCSEDEMRAFLAPHSAEIMRDEAKVDPYTEQIRQYIVGDRHDFEMPIDWTVLTPFQEKALRMVNLIPYGETRTYGDVARELGQPGASRAVGNANARNPMPLVIPCHRVLGSDNRLRGYGGGNGLETKAWLLRMEGVPHAHQLKLF
jgi:methylated-DNA-[protein]-cysteine S-methyltransferase